MSSRAARFAIPGAFALLAATGCGAGPKWEPAPSSKEAMTPPPIKVDDKVRSETEEMWGDGDEGDGDEGGLTMRERIEQFAAATITADISALPPNEKAALDKLIEASRLMDPIFDRQAYANNPQLRAELSRDTTEEGKHKLAYFDIMRGPWDRQDELAPFAIDTPRPPGGGFYPEDLTEKELDEYLAKNPSQAEELTSLFTVVRREEGRLVGIPYSKAYGQWLEPAAKLLREAAELTKNASLKKFLRSRASAFTSDKYRESDKDWMDLDSTVEITIGPYEVYEDRLKALKSAFESYVTVADPESSKKLAKYKSLLADMEAHLPIPEAMKTKRGDESPIRVVDLVFSSGDARKSVQTIAFNLPNDEVVREEKGAKKVLLRNLIRTKFDVILRPIAQRIIAEDQQKHLSADAFFNQVLFHELAHSLGPALAKGSNAGGEPVEVRLALGPAYTALEECKADVMGAYNLLYMIERKEMPASFREPLLVSYFAGLFRSVRFGVAASHGKGAAIQINRFVEAGGATWDAEKGRYTVHFDALEKAIEALVRDLVALQHNGDRAGAEALLKKHGVMSPSMQQAISSVRAVPVDLRPSYPLAGE